MKIVTNGRKQEFSYSFFCSESKGMKNLEDSGVDYKRKVKLSLYGEWMYRSMPSALFGREWSASSPCRFIPRERALDIHTIGDWVDSKAGLDYMKK
jgi:hypothetical protein